MKKSEFLAARSAIATMPDGTKVTFEYKPRFLTKENIEAYSDYLSNDGGFTQKEYVDMLRFLSSALHAVDFQDDAGVDIPLDPTSLEDFGLDFLGARSMINAIFEDMRERANPTPQTEPSSSSG